MAGQSNLHENILRRLFRKSLSLLVDKHMAHFYRLLDILCPLPASLSLALATL